ncbi:hypothetical protein [Alkalibacterium olivapovliticus]|uniref:D-alanine-D-alanine ligase-like ATP-grasp enzyme n=1 Tax=Alkalibacterium olivapovliticus TaxID=99907 RepID=A0A2T0W6Z0_9LACT|nr:hypothetical protein [Alkalibacterium olivapovliticus]PRY82471.1 D-alanine-D-alanine ligase-like ATP-grasp enzyme [Alkalibacterium olivapovliticus]
MTQEQPTLTRSEQKQAELEEREGLKSRLLEEEALRRGHQTRRLTYDTAIITINSQDCLFKDMNGPLSSAANMEICDNKHVARSLLKANGLTVPASTYVRLTEKDKIEDFAQEIGFPVVIKPNNLARGEGVFTHIDSVDSLHTHLEKLSKLIKDETEKILIEKQFIGDDFRFFVVDGEVLATTKRARSNVTGDGIHTVLKLIEAKNKLRLENRDLKNFLIPTDPAKLGRLFRQGKTLDSVLDDGEYIEVRDESNIASGGDGIDFHETVHPTFKEIAVQAIQSVPGLHYGGVDVIAEDITVEPTEDNHVVTEVEFSPGPLSMFPWEGPPRDMAGPILDFYEKTLNS